jgi:hypothetical protein
MPNKKVTMPPTEEELETAASEIEQMRAEGAMVYPKQDEEETSEKDQDPVDAAQEESVALEDLDPEEYLWPDGPQVKHVLTWKQQYGDVYVTAVTYDYHVIWRTLSRPEYKNHVRNMDKLIKGGTVSDAEANMYNEEAIAEICMLFPTFSRADMTDELAGVPALISQEVMEASGFTALEVRKL